MMIDVKNYSKPTQKFSDNPNFDTKVTSVVKDGGYIITLFSSVQRNAILLLFNRLKNIFVLYFTRGVH